MGFARYIYVLVNELAFLHGNSLREAVWSRKIHVQIMRFTCCLNMAFTWKSLNWALSCMHDVTLESVAAVTDHFADAFVRENVARVYMTLWRRNDVRKFDADAILFWEIKCKKFKRRFHCGLCWNQVKYARITITHVCFIALSLAGSLWRCLNTRPDGLVFKQLPRDPANVNAGIFVYLQAYLKF